MPHDVSAVAALSRLHGHAVTVLLQQTLQCGLRAQARTEQGAARRINRTCRRGDIGMPRRCAAEELKHVLHTSDERSLLCADTLQLVILRCDGSHGHLLCVRDNTRSTLKEGAWPRWKLILRFHSMAVTKGPNASGTPLANALQEPIRPAGRRGRWVDFGGHHDVFVGCGPGRRPSRGAHRGARVPTVEHEGLHASLRSYAMRRAAAPAKPLGGWRSRRRAFGLGRHRPEAAREAGVHGACERRP
mmetsp:Transcript_47243/g.123940  ORF Transcript_47243/g.123940 Transcript_47243/m.123940 type:complete len:245 (+) Transcript_47243:246-980(+)